MLRKDADIPPEMTPEFVTSAMLLARTPKFVLEMIPELMRLTWEAAKPSPPRMKPVLTTFATEPKMLNDEPEMVPELVTFAMTAEMAITPPPMLPKLVTVSVAPS